MLVTACAEVQDTKETYESNTVRLNQRLVDTSLLLSEARRAESTLTVELKEAIASHGKQAEKVESLEAVLRQVEEEKAALLSQVGRLQEEAERRESAIASHGKQAEKVESLEAVLRQVEEEKAALLSQVGRLQEEAERRESAIASHDKRAEKVESLEAVLRQVEEEKAAFAEPSRATAGGG